MAYRFTPDRYYVAYGSNLNIEQMRRRCPTAEIFDTAFLNNHRLLYKGSKTGAYLTVEKAKGHKVPIAIWKVSEYDEARLDRYEGYPDFYYKATVHMHPKNGRDYDAFIYIMHEDRQIAIPALYYVETCLQGYEDFGFDSAYLDEAFAYSKEVIQG